MQLISIVAPVFNETKQTLEELVSRISSAVKSSGNNCEIILVDDGSSNNSWNSICELAKKDKKICGVRFSRNFGQHVAIAAGIDHAKGDWVVVMDSDLQDRPEVIPNLYKKAKEGYDVVFVNRKLRTDGFISRLYGRLFFSFLNCLSGQKHDYRQANFSIISCKVADAFSKVSDRSYYYGGTIRWLGFKSSTIDADHGERYSGDPVYTFRTRLRFAIKIIVGYSNKLLYFAIFAGLAMSFISFLMGGYIIINKIINPMLPIPGWPSIITAILFTAGVTNIMLGIVGLYMSDLVERTRGRGSYVISDFSDFD